MSSWDFAKEFDTDLELGSRRKPVEWVAVAPPIVIRNKQNPQKRNSRRQAGPADQQQHGKEADGLQSHESPRSAGHQHHRPHQQREAAAFRHAEQQYRQEQRREKKARRPKYVEKPPELASGVHNRLAEAVMLEAEDDEGNVEYKLRLKQPNPVRFQQLVTQMQYRLSEGNGECFYYLGVEDDGYPRGLSKQDLDSSLVTLRAMAEAVSADIQPLREMPASKGRAYLIVRVHRLCLDELSYTDLHIAVAGSVDSGKSTLVAVLTHGQKGRPLLDNGHGSARMNVLRHKHEIESGRTSSLSHHTLAYDADAGVLNYAGVAPMMPSEIAAAASKVLCFIDLGGHQKYLKTALHGMTSLLPDHVLLCICPLLGLTRVTREHLAVALALELPLAIVLTKVDIAPPAAVEAALAHIQSLLLAATSGRSVTGHQDAAGTEPLCYTLVASEAQGMEVAANATRATAASSRSVPVFQLASTTGAGLSVLHSFLSHLEPAYQPPPRPQEASGSTAAAVGLAADSAQAAASEEQSGPEGNMPPPDDTAYREPWPSAGAPSQVSGVPWALEAGVDGDPVPLAGLLAHLPGSREHRGRGSPRLAVGRLEPSSPGAAAHFQVDQTFEVRGVGSVVSGTLVAGEVALNQGLMLGPTSKGTFTPVTVTSIQRAQVPVKRIRMGQHATLAIHAAAAVPAMEGADRGQTEPTAAAPEPPLHPQTAADSRLTVGPSSPRPHPPAGPPCLPLHSQSKLQGGAPLEAPATAPGGAPETLAEMPSGRNAPGTTAPCHDEWRETPPAGSAFSNTIQSTEPAAQQQDRSCNIEAGIEQHKSGSGSRSRSSLSGDSEHGDSPRISIESQLSKRLSAEEALRAAHAVSLAISNGTEQGGAVSSNGLTFARAQTGQPGCAGSSRTEQGGHSQGEAGTAAGQGLSTLAVSSDRRPVSHTSLEGLSRSAPDSLISGGARSDGNLPEMLPFGGSDDEALPAWAESPTHTAVSAHNSRKGTVLLDRALQPRAVWQFEAVMVLLSGFWPPRGLLSGSWPPQVDSDAEASHSDSSVALDSPGPSSLDRLRSPPSRFSRQRTRSGYTPVVHCGSVRQAARVVAMAEVPLAEDWRIEDACRATGCNLAPAIAAAASLLSQPTPTLEVQSQADEESCIAVVTFRFTHRPEWLQEGARMVVRDRTDGCTAGAGVVRALQDPGDGLPMAG